MNYSSRIDELICKYNEMKKQLIVIWKNIHETSSELEMASKNISNNMLCRINNQTTLYLQNRFTSVSYF